MGGRQRVVISWIPARLLGKPDFSGHPKIPSTNYPAPRQGGGSYLFIARPGTRLAEPVQVYAHGVGTRGISACNKLLYMLIVPVAACLPYGFTAIMAIAVSVLISAYRFSFLFALLLIDNFLGRIRFNLLGKTRLGISGYFILSKKKTGQKMRRDNLF